MAVTLTQIKETLRQWGYQPKDINFMSAAQLRQIYEGRLKGK
jgi:hypothetical protein